MGVLHVFYIAKMVANREKRVIWRAVFKEQDHEYTKFSVWRHLLK